MCVCVCVCARVRACVCVHIHNLEHTTLSHSNYLAEVNYFARAHADPDVVESMNSGTSLIRTPIVSEVSSFQSLKRMQEWCCIYLGWEKCTVRGVLSSGVSS